MKNTENNSKEAAINKKDISLITNYKNIGINIDLGDSLNILALIVGVFIVVKISKRKKNQKKYIRLNTI